MKHSGFVLHQIFIFLVGLNRLTIKNSCCISGKLPLCFPPEPLMGLQRVLCQKALLRCLHVLGKVTVLVCCAQWSREGSRLES